MSALLHAPAELAPILATLDTVRALRGAAPVHGLTPGLLVDDPAGWIPATRFADGSVLPALLDSARDRWGASPHAAAALAWKSYAYWLALPAVVGYAAAARVPDLSAGNVLVRLHGTPPFLEVGLRRPLVAVAPDDPLAVTANELSSNVRVAPDLPGYLRRTLVDEHLGPVLDGLRALVHMGRRTLLGSLASGVAYALVRSSDALPGPVAPTRSMSERRPVSVRQTARTLLTALGVEDLVEITPELGVRRRTCCLAFTLPQPKICSSCCLPSGQPSAQ
jgi:ferric iron reductase protein FhuF